MFAFLFQRRNLRQMITGVFGVVTLLSAVSTAPAAVTLCWDDASAPGGRDWGVIKGDLTCDDVAGGGGLNMTCTDLSIALPPDTPGVLDGFHPSFDGNGILGEFNDVLVIGGEELSPTAVRMNPSGTVEFATLPFSDESNIGGTRGLFYNTFGNGRDIPLPPLAGMEGQFLNAPPVSSDFALVAFDVDFNTNTLLGSEVHSIDIGQLNFQAVPEPAPAFLGLLGALGLFITRRC